ncbi:MAG TPA: SMC-Scp complex subunit ScpB [Firmicutes bacterium]|nr:SMC-Scp complex subunit ScpB [Bacillota bacterium]
MTELFSEDITKAVEALLFVAGEPLTVKDLADYTGSDESTVESVLNDLRAFYSNRGFYLAEIAGGYQFMTAMEMYPYVERLYRPKAQNLSRAAMETLAVIAYCQPVTRGDIENIRGVNADGIVANLLEKGLIDEIGRKDTPGKPVLYGTNRKFLQLLGLNSLEDLPPVNLVAEDDNDNDNESVLSLSEKEVEPK